MTFAEYTHRLQTLWKGWISMHKDIKAIFEEDKVPNVIHQHSCPSFFTAD
jgi:hypothetical protein